ncbi:MAG TPA: methyltransferase domain-containing protein [Methanothermococcus okinawensis]|nr:methyltransferase domain-containing protein [Methanothermococcus okinawensis]
MILKLNVPQWHYSMLQDRERLGVFKWAIERSVKPGDILYDVGTGSGILAMIAARIVRKVYAIELDPITYQYALENIRINGFKNIELIEGDAREYIPEDEVDVVVVEMLDTALITEPQVPVINAILKKRVLKEGGRIIPQRVYNTAQLVLARMNHIYYDEEVKSQPLSTEVLYSIVDFNKVNREEVSYHLEFKIPSDKVKEGKIGIRLNTYTQLTEDTVAGSTPMLNPPLIIPIGNPRIEDNILKVKLSYRMGGDLESIKVV